MIADTLELNPASPPITPDLDMLSFRVRHPDQCNWPDEYYAAAYSLTLEQYDRARVVKAKLEAELERVRLVWQSLQPRAIEAVISGDLHKRDTVTAGLMTLSPWLAILPDLIKGAGETAQQLNSKAISMKNHLQCREREAYHAQRKAEEAARQAAQQAEQDEKLREAFAERDAHRAEQAARITDKQERQIQEAERLEAVRAEAERQAAALLNGKATKK